MPFYTSSAHRDSAARARLLTLQRAKTLGVIVEPRLKGGGWHEILLTAPSGKKFHLADLHEQVFANAGPTTDGLWESTARALEGETLVDCPDSECEWCRDNS